ncbi:limb region 1 homolog-like protein [Danio rerio]|uniref:Limb region 1 homolog-like protein n=1 Tax=Danio rerio TaxID=7955 RepID=LMBRL_DANRE|nr:limb region 1 homolog-like protein [Danio rerio]Q803C7.1 RecName: Full=Limb region 1 homolog-like protein [Danio rerio]AAH44535.1 Limb region 1 like [Danio rerio]|eukprot:NP_942575.1 limb region 1 homolog-like protein [Danio rerio]
METEDVTVREQIFHDRVRETIICVLLFICLYILSHFILTHFKKSAEFVTDDIEDATVNKIALWLCTFTLSVAVCAVLLLPISILSNEVLLTFPHSYYMQWLNGSLIRGLWNLVFLFSNLSLVFLMPFAYFFTESEGFAGSKKGVMARVYETAVMLLLLSLLVLGIVWVASALLHHNTARESLYDLWEYYLPYLYSGISLFGVLLLLLCTPFGLSRMFSVTGSLLVKPRLLENLEETMNCAVFEEASLSRKLKSTNTCWISAHLEALNKEFLSVQSKRITLELRKRASPWQRNLVYPVAMLLLLALTAVSVLMVCFHVLELLFDESAMPRGMEDPHLGLASFSMLGSLGAAVQVVIILYLMVSSVVGFYSSPLFTGLLPRAQDTTLTQIIGNCVSLLILSSALPVFSRTLGITKFDLLGDFGRHDWLGSFHIVFLYNMLFAGLTSACLINTVTWALQRELIRAFGLHRLPLTVSRSTIPLKLLLANGLSKIH